MSSETLTLAQLVVRLRGLGLHVAPEGDRLRVRGPAGALPVELRDAIARHRQGLLRLLRPPAAAPPAGAPSDRTRYPLSHNQRQLWFEQQLHPAACHYNVPLTLRVAASVSAAALEQALGALVRRHPLLLARFPLCGDTPEMELGREGIRLAVADCDADDDVLERWAQEWSRRPFDLAQEAPFRACLLRRWRRPCLLLVTLHHIVADGCSMGILMRDFARAYGACSAGEPWDVAVPGAHYGDYALWQTAAERRLAWRPQVEQACALLRDVPEPRVPLDLAPPERSSLRGGLVKGRLARPDRERLAAVARACGTTLFPVFLAAYMALMHHETGQERFTLGSDVAGREDPMWDDVVGHFVNQIVLVADLRGNPSIEELVRRAALSFARAHESRAVPYDALVHELRGRGPLFRAKIVMQPPLEPALGTAFEVLSLHDGNAKFDLLWNVWLSQDGIGLALEYSRDLFHESTGERLFRHLERLLEAFRVDALARPLDRLTGALSASERARSRGPGAFAARAAVKQAGPA